MDRCIPRNAMNIWGTISPPSGAGPVVDTVGIPAMADTFLRFGPSAGVYTSCE
jgi:hypothetical protein